MDFGTHKKWMIFLLLTLFSLWASGYVQREIHALKGKTQTDFFDFQVYYLSGLVARGAGGAETDKRLYAYQEIADPADPGRRVVVNPQLQPYNPDTTFGRVAREQGFDVGQFLYPPFFSALMIPLTYLGFERAEMFWHVFIFFLAAAAVFLTVRYLYRDYLTIAVICGAAVVTLEFTLPMQDLLMVCNVGTIILFLTAAGLFLHRKHPALGALVFALAVIIKLTPVVVVPLMLMRRQWKWLAAFAGWSALLWGASLWLLGWENHYEFFARVMPAMSDGIPLDANRSLSTAFYALFTGRFLSFEDVYGGAYFFPPRLPILLFKLTAGLTFFGLLAFLWRAGRTASQLYAEVLLVTLWSIIFSPVSFKHYYLLAVAPVVFAWVHPYARKAPAAALAALAAGTFLIFSVLPAYGLVVTESFAVRFAGFMAMPVGVLLCMAYLMALVKSENEVPEESAAPAA